MSDTDQGQKQAAPQGAAPAGLDQFIAPEMQAQANEDQYGGLGEQAKTFGEGALDTLTFGAGPGIERALGVKTKDIRGRRETNEVAHTAGEFAGLLSPIGEGAAAASIGERVAGALVPEAANVIQKVGSAAVKGAVENAIIGTGDEVSKALAQDPDQTLQTAITNIGLSGLIGAGVGGALGTVSPLWEATVGPKANDFLQKIQSRANGETLPVNEGLGEVLASAKSRGTELSPEVIAGISEDPRLNQTFSELRESGTMSGEAVRQSLDQFKDELHGQLQAVLTPGEDLSPKELGDRAKVQLRQKADAINDQVKAAYDAVGDTTSIPVEDKIKEVIGQKIEALKSEFAQGSPQAAQLERMAGRVKQQENIGQLNKYMTELGNDWSVAHRAGDFESRRAVQLGRDVIREGMDSVLDRAMPQASANAKVARQTYQKLIEHLSDIAEAGHLGKVKSMGQFEDALEKIPSEKLADKLFDKKNVESLRFLQKTYPDMFESLVQQKRADILHKGTNAKNFNPNSIFKEIENLPKEVKSMVFKPQEITHLEGIRDTLRAIPDRINPSGTARTLDTLWRHMPVGGGAVAGMLAGHNPLAGLVLGQAAKYFGRDVPDAMKLSLLKFLGSSGPVDASAWKSAAELIEHAYKGQALIEKSTKAIFKAGQEVLPKTVLPSEKDTDRLKKKLEAYRQDPTGLLDVGGKTGYYMPEHAQAIGSLAAQTVNYLNTVAPKPVPSASPLDTPSKVSKADEARWNRTLEIAQQPLMVLEHMKRGQLQMNDVVALQHMYPKLYSQLNEKILGQIANQKQKDDPISYKTKMSLSLFMGQPLDSTMTPQAFMATQGVQSTAQPKAPQAPQGGGHKGSMKLLGEKTNAMYETPIQSREMNRQGRS